MRLSQNKESFAPPVDRNEHSMELIEFVLRGEHITLDALLKATGLASSGGAAKAMVADGKVQVDGRDELRKTCKIRPGQVVAVLATRIQVVQPTANDAPAESAQDTP